ncbi:MAG: hypothetical protein GY711_33520 [bacterium]|nr:hypothetical protein [bacterium]
MKTLLTTLVGLACVETHALAQTYIFDTGDTEYALSMGAAHVPGELAMLHGFAANGTDVLAEIQAAVGTAMEPAGALDGLQIRIAVWDDPNDDFDPLDAVLLYESPAMSVTQSNSDVKVRYSLPGVPVQGVFFIGAVVQDLGTFPAGADIDVPFVPNPVSWLVGEGPGVSLDLTDLEVGDSVLGGYSGGRIVHGSLIGVRRGSRFEFRYLQLQDDGVLDGGVSQCEIERAPDGRVRIVEHFEWESREGSGRNVIEEVGRPPAAALGEKPDWRALFAWAAESAGWGPPRFHAPASDAALAGLGRTARRSRCCRRSDPRRSRTRRSARRSR